MSCLVEMAERNSRTCHSGELAFDWVGAYVVVLARPRLSTTY